MARKARGSAWLSATAGRAPPEGPAYFPATAATHCNHQRAVTQTRFFFHLDPNVNAHSLIICKAHYYKLFLSPPPINEQIPKGNADISKYSQERAIRTHTRGV